MVSGGMDASVCIQLAFLSHRVYNYFHSFWPFLQRLFKSSTIQRRSRLQHGYYIGVSRRSAQATAGKGLAQGFYVADRAGVEPTTLRLKVIASTNAPPRATLYNNELKQLYTRTPINYPLYITLPSTSAYII